LSRVLFLVGLPLQKMVLHSQEIAMKVYDNLLSTNKQNQINAIKENYALDSEFIDPLVSTNSAEETLVQYLLLSYMSRVKGTPKTVMQTIENGRDVVLIDGIQEFGVTSWKYLTISLRVITKFEFLNGKIVKHEDVWSFADLILGIPFVGVLYSLWRPIFATLAAKLHQAITGGPKLHHKN
jgi:hypothetical protein